MNATHTPEEWRPVPPFVGFFEASNHGRVRSVRRRQGKRLVSGKVLALRLTKRGYLMVNMQIAGKRVEAYAHRAVCAAFHGEPQPGQEVRHLNGIPSDNRPENLRWGTGSDNSYDRVRHGTYMNGSMKKTHCPRGHLLLAPNLLNGKLINEGRRSCRACANAACYRVTHPEADFITQAERYYRRYLPLIGNVP